VLLGGVSVSHRVNFNPQPVCVDQQANGLRVGGRGPLRVHAADRQFGVHLGRLREKLWNLSRCWGVDDDVGISTEPAAAQRPSIAFDGFYSDVWPRAFRLASFLTHDTQAGEDIAQDVLAAMSQRWDRVVRPEAYLQRAITNASWKWVRQARTATLKLPLLAAPSGDEFRFDELADAIARLPFQQRAVVVLRYYADLTETDIAHSLGCRPGTVKSLASRALATLSKEITHHEPA
jgi:RNA polymerase sigma-70 factor (sigma-E family)